MANIEEALSGVMHMFGKLYRSLTYSSFILMDTGNIEVDGKSGYIAHYHSSKRGFCALICFRGSSNHCDAFCMIVKLGNMEPMNKIRHKILQ